MQWSVGLNKTLSHGICLKKKYILSSFQQIVILFNSIMAALQVIHFTLEFLNFLKCSLTITKVILLWYKKHIAGDMRVELNQ